MSHKIRIPKHIWNDYEPGSKFEPEPHVDAAIRPAPRLRLRLNIPAATRSASYSEPEDDARAFEKRTHCKAKLIRFHYGGPQRQRKGQWQNEITYEQPCLQPT